MDAGDRLFSINSCIDLCLPSDHHLSWLKIAPDHTELSAKRAIAIKQILGLIGKFQRHCAAMA